ncbi:MAG TPA: pitrilysin family protein [Steroidobacteraceae bacterium]|nr:pitrilysin family protein [Steroidobacteraceae bacterium]
MRPTDVEIAAISSTEQGMAGEERALNWPGGALARSGAAVPLGAAAGSFAAAAALVRTQVLANGLTLVVWPDHNIPSVALHNWVRVGSRNEGTGRTGLAHFFEHMMFNGTSARAQGEFDRLMERQGGSNNAYTSQDVTVYQDWFPRSALELVFELESDRIANLALRVEVVENERKVVYSERRLRVEDSNAALLDEQVQASAFRVHPYRIPTIGWPADIESWTMADLQQFYRTYYAPNNCTLILVGDVEPDEAFALAERTFGKIPAGPAPPPVQTIEPEQRGERRVVLERPGQNPLLQIAYHAIQAADSREPALNLLQTILVGGDASRLHRSLVEEQRLAVAIGGGWSEGFDPNVFTLQATLPADGELEAAQAAIDAELARLLAHGVTEAELQRAKNMVAADFWRGVATIDGKARLLGEYAVMHGDAQLLFSAPEGYGRVTREQIQAIARTVFNPERRTVGILRPLEELDELEPQSEPESA